MADTRATLTLAANLDPSGVLSAVKAMQGAFSSLKLPDNIGEGLDKSLSKATDLLKKYQGQLAKGINTKTDAKNITKTGAQINEVLDEISHYINDLNGQQIFLKADVGGLNKLQAGIENARTAWKNAIQEFRKGSDIDKVLSGIGEKTTRSNLTQGSINKARTLFDKGDLEGYRNALDEIYSRLSKLKDTTVSNVVKNLGLEDAGSKSANLEQIKRQLEAISKIDFSSDANVKAQFDEITNAVSTYETEVERAGNAGQEAFNNINASSAVNNTRALIDATDQYTNSIMSAKDQVQDLQRSTQYFFSLRNMLNLLKRGIDDAIQSVKELDAAMTETAVVTDYKVSDLWGMLPQYTQLANQLGATTQGAYETMTLYFQQGLDQQQAFEIGAETMKMARIAGLDYAETTDMMTAALRGFNMELNETSAKRINDVYSELAAITASDTEELGTAMQRTASIAHSAGMSFEGTTAFLAQAIETTREPAENIGTAMKTIVARFQEMKENPLEISEVDGEEVNYNKVDAALKSIGVSLKDTNGQFRELDQVFLDISSRWDGLSQTQQRYIATVAAGSRQQSRFIAMMDNYDRTVQLFEAANNSAGASDEQFGKTMDSLESKLNKLHNAWQAFTMGIANNGMIKLAVDGLTGFLTVTNKIIDTLSLGSGAIKSFLSVFAAFTGLKVAGRAANSLIGGLGGLVDPKSTVKEGLKTGLFGQGKTNAQAQAITTPIVGVLNKISGQIAQIKNNSVNNKGQSNSEVRNTSKQEYANIKAQFDKLSGKEGFKMSDASKLFGKLDAKHQLSMLNNSPGTRTAMKKASMAWFDTKGLSKELTGEGKQYISSIYKGMQEGQIPVDKGIELIGQPDKWGEYFATDTAKSISKHFELTDDDRRRIVNQTWSKLGMNLAAPETKAAWLKENQAEYDRMFSQIAYGHGEAQGKVSDLGRFANDIGAVGDKFTQAGYGVTAFGNALSQLGGPIGAVGTGIAAFGGAISSMGMMVSGATSLITVFSEGIEIAGTSIAISGGTIAAIAAPLAAAAAAFLLVRAYLQKVKEAGEEVTKTFNDTNKEVDGNISKLKSYQSEFATLSQGVDSNGNNVSLDDSQYQRYLEIVDDIAKINPEIVQGYNAQGHAIIDNNKALDETLKKQQQIKKETLDTYTKTGSLQKLINARNINKDYKQIQSTKQSGVADGSGHGNEGRSASIGSAVPLAGDVSSIADKLRLTKGFDSASLKKFGIESLDDLLEGEEQAVKNFIKHRNQIQAELTNSGIKLNEGLIKGFDKLNTDQKAFDEAIQPVYDNLLASVSNSPFYEEIGSEFKNAIALGLKDIASQDLNASEMQSQAKSLVQEFDNLTREGSKYATAMEQVESAQDKFASSLDVSEYAKNTEGALNTLNSLLKEYEGNTTAYGQAITEYLTNQIEKIKNFTEEGSMSLTEALNGMTNTISAAEGAYDAFQESTKTDFSTGAQSMKSIFEEVTKETDGVMLHMEKFGDGTMWKGARALLGDEFVEKNSENVELVKKELLSLKDELQDGEKGFAAFWKNFEKVDDSKIKGFTWNEDGSYDIDRDVNPDAYKEIAEQMHRSEQYVVSMLNKGRQFADIDFTNVEDVRKALSTDTGAIAGTSTTDGNTDIFVKKDYLQNAMMEAGIVSPAEQAQETEKLLAKGIKTIPGPESITKKDFQRMGVSDIPSLIRKFGDTGQFNRSEIEEYAQQMDGYNAGEFNTLYKDYLDSQEHPELPSINSIDNNVASILGLISHEHGQLTQEDKEAHDKARQDVIGELGVADTIPQLFAKGLNKDGDKLSKDEYNQTVKNLDKQAETYDKAAEFYDNLAKKAKEANDTEAEKKAQKYADDYEKWAQDIRDYKQAGINQYKEDQQKKEAPIPGKDSSTIAQEERIKATQAANKIEKEALEKHNKEKAAINQAYTTKEREELKKEVQNRQHERQNYEQQAQNASGPTDGLLEKDSTYKPYALNSVGTEISHLLSERTNDIFEAINPLDAVKKVLDSNPVPSKTEIQSLYKPYETVTPENIDQYSGGKNMAGMHNFMGNLIKSMLDGDWTSEGEAAASEASEKASSIWQKMWSGVKKVFNNSPEFTSPSTSTTSKPSAPSPSTVNKGTSAVANVAQNVVQTVTTQEQGVDETQKKLDAIRSTASKGAKMKVEASQNGSLKTVQSQLDKIKGSAASGATIKVNSGKGDVIGKMQQKASKTAEMPLKIKDLATAKINKINANAKKPVNKTVNISPNYIGTWQKEFKVIEKKVPGGYTGLNNKISFHHVPMAGSLARGTKKGRVGPRNQGGLTLTGEEGYEIAWIPSESRSAILGASGPEMVNLPKEAVVYNHDQSKQIMKKRKSIPAGSMDRGGPYTPPSDGNTGGNSGGGGNNSTSSKAAKQSLKAANEGEKAAKKAGKVSVYWENLAHKNEALQRKMDKNQKLFEKLLKAGGTTQASIAGTVDEYKKSLNQIINLNQEAMDVAKGELNRLDSGKKVKVSYKSGKKTKTTKINTKKYIDTDPTTGAYVINQAAISKKAGKNKELAKAIKAEAEKQIKDYEGKYNSAEDAVTKAQEALTQLADDMYTAFHQWEKTITQVYLLGQRLEQLTKQRDVYEAAFDSEIDRLSAHFGNAEDSLPRIRSALNQSNELLISQLDAQSKLIEGTYDEYANALDLTAYRKKTIDANPESPEAQSDYAVREATLQFLSKIGITDMDKFDYSAAVQELEARGYNEKSYNQIKEGLDDIKSIQDGYYSSIEDTYKKASEIYGLMNEYQSFISEFEGNLLDGMAEQTEAEINRLDKLNTALAKAMKELLDEVKRKLDERRQKEDNQKTESDISKKQQRLTALRADTSGGHATEIAQLEKEIAEARQNYGRTLEDQLIEKLQNQADIAEKQRERQIELLEGQKELAEKTGTNLEQVRKWLQNPQANYEQIREAYFANAKYDEAPPGEQSKIEAQFEADFAKYLGYSEQLKALQTIDEHVKAILDRADEQAGVEHIDREKTQKELVSVNDKLTKEQETKESLQKDLGEAQSNLDSLEQQRLEASKQLASAKEREKETQKAYGAAQNQYQAALQSGDENQIAAAGAKLRQARTNHIKAKRQAEEAQANVTQIDTSIAKAKTNVDSIKSKIAETDANINNLKQQKTELEGLLNAQDGIKEPDIKFQEATAPTAAPTQANTASQDLANMYQMAIRNFPFDMIGVGGGNGFMREKGYDELLRIAQKLGYNERQVLSDLVNIHHGNWEPILSGFSRARMSNKIDLERLVATFPSSALQKALNDRNIINAYKDRFEHLRPLPGMGSGKYQDGQIISMNGQRMTPYDYLLALVQRYHITPYKKGGIADFTGPAWLDGTPSKPELVLNATDTKNFIALKDVLSRAMSSVGHVENSYGGNANFEININVDHISNDYDVNKVVDQVEKRIVQKSGYRNVTQVRNFR